MQDRFKVRAWDTEEDRYASDEDICFDTCGSCDSVYALLMHDDPFYVYEQCTGLKDKNGKLIYEGDILHFNHENYVVFYDEVEAIWAMDNQKGNLKSFSGEDTSNMEVVGNIHENSNLLKNNRC